MLKRNITTNSANSVAPPPPQQPSEQIQPRPSEADSSTPSAVIKFTLNEQTPPERLVFEVVSREDFERNKSNFFKIRVEQKCWRPNKLKIYITKMASLKQLKVYLTT